MGRKGARVPPPPRCETGGERGEQFPLDSGAANEHPGLSDYRINLDPVLEGQALLSGTRFNKWKRSDLVLYLYFALDDGEVMVMVGKGGGRHSLVLRSVCCRFGGLLASAS